MAIELNFFEIEEQNFEIKVYIHPFDFCLLHRENKKFKLEVNGNLNDYEVSFLEREDFEKITISSFKNKFLTLWYISNLLKNSGLEFSDVDEFEKNKIKFFVEVEKYDVGVREIYIQPEYISKLKKFGFIIGFHFRNLNEYNTVKEQQLSFSLTNESFPKANSFYNKDIRFFLSSNFNKKIIPIFEKINFKIIAKPLSINENILANCFYSNNEIEQISNFNLLKNNKKYKKAIQKNYYFIFRKSEREFALKVHNTLSGQLYPSYVSGLKNMFDIDIKNLTNKFEIFNFDDETVDRIESDILHKDKDAFLIFCMPKREADYAEKFYLECKLRCLKNDVSSQFLYLDRLFYSDKLKYSGSNIALQIFCKSGGIPWKVTNRKLSEEKLIIGIGTCHKNNEKFYAYAVCSDSSGVFNFSMSLSFSKDKESYFKQLRESLIYIQKNRLENKFKSIVFHITTRISIYEMTRIEEIIKEVFEKDLEIVILKLNKSKKYIGFSINRNDCVVKKGSIFELDKKKTLLWTDGCVSDEKISNRPSKPLDIELLYPSEGENKIDYLDDIYKLSNANWHGFNSNSLPVSLVYSKNIANFVALLYEYGKEEELSELSLIQTNIPWFL